MILEDTAFISNRNRLITTKEAEVKISCNAAQTHDNAVMTHKKNHYIKIGSFIFRS